MKANFAPSTNIIRDDQVDLKYIVTPNTQRSALQILSDYRQGFRAFSIIGSYGTGKSSFLWAFKNSLSGNKHVFDLNLPQDINNVSFIEFVGDYESLITVFRDYFSVKKDYTSNQVLFDSIYQAAEQLGETGLLVLVLDEFGKYLEYAAKNNPEKEMYFIQQLSEFVNSPDRNILLLTTLHQGFDSYAYGLTTNQKNEWYKVKGRLREIVFNEPVEQLMELAANHIEKSISSKAFDHESFLEIQERNRILPVDNSFLKRLGAKLYPFDIFSCFVITKSLQKYGQNERSLFSFFSSSENYILENFTAQGKRFDLPAVYDYLYAEYYFYLTTKANADYNNWSEIRNALERIETLKFESIKCAEDLIKTIGILRIFASKAAQVDQSFIVGYLRLKYEPELIEATLEALNKYNIIKWSDYSQSFKVFEGSDLDINEALLKADSRIEEIINVVPKLETHFDFPVVAAKAHSYAKGTPRLFEYILSEKPQIKKPKNEIDGFINLVFNSKLNIQEFEKLSADCNEPILFGYFTNTDRIIDSLREIEKTTTVLKEIHSDKVASSELQSILKSNEKLLNHFVLDTMFDGTVKWFYKGEVLQIRGSKELNKQLSKICDEVYDESPVIKNELFNRHKISGSIANARKLFFGAMVNRFQREDLGFDQNKFPPEKTIYYTLLQKTGIHRKGGEVYTLSEPGSDSSLFSLWKVCDEFLNSTKTNGRKLTDLYELLLSAPIKLKQGVVDFWVPIFLFIRRGDYALYSSGILKPFVNEQELYLITRNPDHYTVKAFEMNNLRLTFFNKYRELLKQPKTSKLKLDSFIESIRPILMTYRRLTIYSQKTRMISKEAQKLRESIANAKEPDKVFFEEFPAALGYDIKELISSDKTFDAYINDFQQTLREIQNSYNALLERLEMFILKELIKKEVDFLEYKDFLGKRFSGLKDHQLNQKQSVFLQRINSPLDDRNSWLASVSQAIIGKPLHSISDKDEANLKVGWLHMIHELENLASIYELDSVDGEEIVKVEITSVGMGLIPRTVRIEGFEKGLVEKVKGSLGDTKEKRIALLVKLLKEEFDSE